MHSLNSFYIYMLVHCSARSVHHHFKERLENVHGASGIYVISSGVG
jgi:hypothetical protein